MAGSLYQFWDLHGHYTEGLRRLELARRAGAGVPAADRSRVLIGIGTLATIQNDLERAIAACEEAVAVSRAAGDAAGAAHALQYLGLIAIYTADLLRARELLDASLATAHEAGATWEHGWPCCSSGCSPSPRASPRSPPRTRRDPSRSWRRSGTARRPRGCWVSTEPRPG